MMQFVSLLLFLLVHVSQLLGQECPPWDYTGANGPQFWGNLCGIYHKCKNGLQQSPVNFHVGTAHPSSTNTGGITFWYEPSTFKITNTEETIRVEVEPGSTILYPRVGEQFELKNFAIRIPSEHTVNGNSYPMELQLYHENPRSGKVAIVGILFELQVQPTAWFSSFLPYVPENVNEVNETDFAIPLEHILPVDRTYWYYKGSLTAPPCTEEVDWFVFKSSQRIGRDEHELLSTRLFQQPNARPTQPLHGRLTPASLNGFTWVNPNFHPKNANHRTYQSSEGHKPLAGIEVQLWDFDGNYVARTLSGHDGRYSFPNLPSEPFFVTFIFPHEYEMIWPRDQYKGIDLSLGGAFTLSTGFKHRECEDFQTECKECANYYYTFVSHTTVIEKRYRAFLTRDGLEYIGSP